MSSGSDLQLWITNFCQLFGHEFFVPIPPAYIEDDFNLTGLSALVPYYREALYLILDYDDLEEIARVHQQDTRTLLPIIEHLAELLYGLIHARYVLTKHGLALVAQKFEAAEFGTCPRVLCDAMPLLPLGRHDLPGRETVRLYCACCNDVYLPLSSKYLNIDGAFFGTSLPGMFLKVFGEIRGMIEEREHGTYEPRCFGFKVHETAVGGLRMQWLRLRPGRDEVAEFDACEYGIPVEEP